MKIAKQTVSNLRPATYNPREISKLRLAQLGESMRRFGDLSGIVKNITTGNLVGGHQRVKHFKPDWPIDITMHAGTDKTLDSVGTVAQGLIQTPFGHWTYRVVCWPLSTEKAANVAANAQGGMFDLSWLEPIVGSGLKLREVRGHRRRREAGRRPAPHDRRRHALRFLGSFGLRSTKEN